MTDPVIIHGPTADQNGGRIIYQVTLAQGMVLTNPADFGGLDHPTLTARGPVVTEDGRVIPPPTPA
jgi:hypothetical protein